MEKYNLDKLAYTKILLIESPDLAKDVQEYYFRKHRIIVLNEEQMPQPLLQYMNNVGVDTAVVHNITLDEEQSLLKAVSDQTKKIILFTRMINTEEHLRMYARLKSAGVVVLDKKDVNYFDDAVNALAGII